MSVGASRSRGLLDGSGALTLRYADNPRTISASKTEAPLQIAGANGAYWQPLLDVGNVEVAINVFSLVLTGTATIKLLASGTATMADPITIAEVNVLAPGSFALPLDMAAALQANPAGDVFLAVRAELTDATIGYQAQIVPVVMGR